MKKPICIYHGNCPDGFTAAWAVWKTLPDIDFHPGFYGEDPPSVKNRSSVILVDFSYKRDVLLKMAEEAHHILILDHHKSAEAELVDLPGNVEAVFDMERSGAMMAWQHFHPGKSPSDLVVHVQDRDLWQFKRSTTKEFMMNLLSHEYTFDNWECINMTCADDYKYHSFVAIGEGMLRKHMKDVRELIAKAAYRDTIGGYDVPVLNAPYFYSSEAGHILSENEPFAACYWDEGARRIYSLRSADSGIDVSKVAQLFGGGGHEHAAGFRIAR